MSEHRTKPDGKGRRRAQRVEDLRLCSTTGEGPILRGVGDERDRSMCEYCGCLSLRVVQELTDEHDDLLDLVRDATRAVAQADTEGAAAAVSAMLRVLGPHTAVEEEALFPAMHREYGEHVAALHGEHVRIESALTSVAAGIDLAPTWRDSLLAALHLLREHIKKEQDGLFPAALATLSADDWDAVENVRARVGSGLADRP
jgi:hemerythrin-like domain-containing protein